MGQCPHDEQPLQQGSCTSSTSRPPYRSPSPPFPDAQVPTPQVTDVTSPDLRCYTSATNATASTISVAAGSPLGFACDETLYHHGVVNVYMARAPAHTDVAQWDGAGRVWFKTHEITAVTDGGRSIAWPAQGLASVNFTLPRALPGGKYQVRVEAIALHEAERVGGAQFYVRTSTGLSVECRVAACFVELMCVRCWCR